MIFNIQHLVAIDIENHIVLQGHSTMKQRILFSAITFRYFFNMANREANKMPEIICFPPEFSFSVC